MHPFPMVKLVRVLLEFSFQVSRAGFSVKPFLPMQPFQKPLIQGKPKPIHTTIPNLAIIPAYSAEKWIKQSRDLFYRLTPFMKFK